jgi:sugar phosphate isomerase/epimerase
MDELLDLAPSPRIGVNFDTGNAYLCGRSDIYAWMEHVRDRLVHVHAKDITAVQGKKERGRVSGTAVGCACGDGVIDWQRIVRICLDAPRDIVLSVECGSHDEAKRSHAYLSRILAELAIAE